MDAPAEQRLFAEIREITHTLRGNGSKGLVSRIDSVEECLKRMAEEREKRELEIRTEKQQALDAKKNSIWRHIYFTGAGVAVALVMTAIWTNYINRTPSPVEKRITAEEQQAKDETKRQLDEIKQTLKDVSERQVAPAKPPGRYIAPKPKPQPKHGALLRPGEMITTKEFRLPELSYNRIPVGVPER